LHIDNGGKNRFTHSFQIRFSLSCFQSDNPIEEDFMTPASRQAQEGLRDLTMLKWYVIPLIAYTAYRYTLEEESAP
jgi:hypothetical protein